MSCLFVLKFHTDVERYYNYFPGKFQLDPNQDVHVTRAQKIARAES